ncbi:MAG: hypothetical protein CVV34_03050, partial [Methanomicrobiales archaeon HGW-Methanomicrobiales-5]
AFKKRFPGKVKLVLRDDNQGITASSQEAFRLTDGDYVALLDHDDYLVPEALYEVVKLLNRHPETDWIYSDNDKLDSQGRHCCPHVKPDWSPELLLTYNYILHLSVIRRSLIERAGGFREGFEGSQDHDLYLRLAELTGQVRHIPRVLYSWRQSADSVALNPANKHYAFDAALRALNDALKRRGERGQAQHPAHSWLGSYQIIRHIETPDIDVIVLEAEGETAPVLDKLTAQTRVNLTSVSWLEPDEGAGKCLNRLVKQCQSPYVLLLMPTIALTDTTLLLKLTANLAPQGVALSSAKVINTYAEVDHCGLAYRRGVFCYPLRGWDKTADGMGAYGGLPRNISLSSAVINVCKTAQLQPLLARLGSYETANAWLVALALELQKQKLRLVVDGGLTVLYTPAAAYQVTLSASDKALLQRDYAHLFSTDDPLYHRQML